jgi:hypothetical protein
LHELTAGCSIFLRPAPNSIFWRRVSRRFAGSRIRHSNAPCSAKTALQSEGGAQPRVFAAKSNLPGTQPTHEPVLLPESIGSSGWAHGNRFFVVVPDIH